MTKLDDAVEAAAKFARERYGADHYSLPDDLVFSETDLKAAIQAAVNVLVPGPVEYGKGPPYYSFGYVNGHNACRAEILKNAEITDV